MGAGPMRSSSSSRSTRTGRAEALPEQLPPLFRRVIPTGIEHGTVTVLQGGLSLEVTTLRADRSYRDGRRPDEIEFVKSIDEDRARRGAARAAPAAVSPRDPDRHRARHGDRAAGRAEPGGDD